MRLPRHATVVAYLALFVALGGTAYAATGGNFVLGRSNQADKTSSLKNTGAGAALKLSTVDSSTPPLAVSNGTKVTHLNADEVDGLSSGAFQRKAARISASTSAATGSTHTVPAGSVGPWSFTLTCKAFAPGSGGLATFKITGPGTAGGTHTVASGINGGNTFVAAQGGIGSGYTMTADTNEQLSATFFLQSGSDLAELDLLLTATDNAPPENCDVIGAATLVAS
jgi:hypothetical protein